MSDPNYSLSTTALIVVSVVFPLLATVAVLLRFYVRKLKKNAFELDDWLALVSLVLCWGLAVNIWVFSSIFGVNRIPSNLTPEEAGLQTFKFLYINEVPFSIVIGTVKLSVLFFYKRTFPLRKFQIAVWIMISIIAAWTIAVLLVSIFEFWPIDGGWTDPANSYTIDDNAYSVAVASMSLGFDVVILTMPLFVISTSYMPLRRKVLVMMIFWLGGVCCVAASVRLALLYRSIHGVSHNPDAYYTLSLAFIFAEIEPNMSVVAASLPMLRPLFISDGPNEKSFFGSFSGWKKISSRFNSSGASKNTEPSLDYLPGASPNATENAKHSLSSTKSTTYLHDDLEMGQP